MTDLALNPFKKGKKGEVEKIQNVEVEKDPSLEKAIEQFLSLKPWNSDKIDTNSIKYFRVPVLDPPQINLLLKEIIRTDFFHETKHQSYNVAGMYLTKLIQESNNEGHNNFVLDLEDYVIGYLGYRIIGGNNEPLKLTINGDVGMNTADNSYNVNLSINGDYLSPQILTTFGEKCINSNYFISGNIGGQCGNEAKFCNFEIGGNVSDIVGFNALKSNFIIAGTIADDCGTHSVFCKYDIRNKKHEGNFARFSKNSEFIVRDEKLYDTIYKKASLTNTITLVDDKENVIKRIKKCQHN